MYISTKIYMYISGPSAGAPSLSFPPPGRQPIYLPRPLYGRPPLPPLRAPCGRPTPPGPSGGGPRSHQASSWADPRFNFSPRKPCLEGF